MVVKSFEVVYLNSDRIRFERSGDTLSMTLVDPDAPGGQMAYPRVVLRSCFPVADHATFISVRDAADEDQAEIGVIEDCANLAPADRDAVLTELRLNYFVPQVKQVLSIREELGFLYWDVITDKGKTELVMRNNIIRCTREVAPGRWLIIDVNEARYEIPDVSKLDARGRKLLQQFLCF